MCQARSIHSGDSFCRKPRFGPAGALAFADDALGAEICLLDGGHFLLESQLDTAGYIRGFLERTVGG
jgi:hypothetical protein